MDSLNKFQYFNIFQTVNDKRDIKGLILDNGIKIVLISDKNIITSSCSIAVNAGYLQDEYEGTAHFLEHLLFMGSEKFPSQNEYHSYISVCGGMDNAFTGDNITCYFLEIESNFMKKGIEMLSWFFKKPLLDEKLIKSEMEIINSEHEKNILSDLWITDDILKKIIKPSKYTKFGTGNNESLKNIKREDILKYYNNYYTTDNMYVCIVDNKSIDDMIKDYIIYFNNIDKKKMPYNALTIDKLELKNENLVIYKSISKYNFFNIILFIKYNREKKDHNEFIIVNFINYLLEIEYNNSLIYYLKEYNLIKSMHVNIDYYFDDNVLINLNMILVDNDVEKLNEVYCQFYTYLDIIKNLDEKQFEYIYNNYQKIKLLNSLYKENNISSSETSNDIINNIINGKLELAILRKNYVNDYNTSIYNIFKEMVNNIIIKISTNININNKNNYIKSNWYNTEYYLSEYENINLENINKKNNFNFKIENIVTIKNFKIESYINLLKIDKKKIPALIFKENNKEIYLLEENKYDKPICSINVIRRNKKLLDNNNNIITGIYILLCNKILNFYLESMGLYYCYFTIGIHNEYIIYSYTGLYYLVSNEFIKEINKMINIDSIFSNNKIEKYFLQIKRDMIEKLVNSKYDSPHVLCLSYLYNIIKNIPSIEMKIKFIENLTLIEFKNILINECLIYDYEYFIIVGMNRNINNKEINNNMISKNIISKNSNNISYNYNDDDYLKNIINIISVNERIFYKNNIEYDEIKYKKTKNYKLLKDEFNSGREINNCLIEYGIIYSKEYLIINNNFNEKDTFEIIKNKIIASIVSHILNEPLFDRIRTIDKLGYIVKCNNIHISKNNNFSIILFYLIQSTYDVNKIKLSIKNFNNYMLKDIKDNYDNYFEKFNSLKKSKLLELKKPFSNLLEEISTYLDSFVSNIYIFNIHELTYKICKKIKFEDILFILKKFLQDKSEKYNIILDSKN